LRSGEGREDGDCATAALAAVVRERTGDVSLVPTRPATRDATQMTRQLCVLAHYELLGGTHATLVISPASTGFAIVQRGNSEQMGAERCASPPGVRDGALQRDDCTTDDEKLGLTYTTEQKRLVLSKIEIADRPACK